MWLKTGPSSARNAEDKARRQAIFKGHMSNMQRLAEEKKLIVAGPFGKEKHDKDDRGIFVFDVATVEEARRLVETDPGIEAGEFRAVIRPMRASSTLRRTLDLEKERLQGRAWNPAQDGRIYQLVVATDEAAARAALAPLEARGKVLWSGRFGGEGEGSGVFVLDAATADEARELIGAGLQSMGECWFDTWFASKSLEGLPAMRREG